MSEQPEALRLADWAASYNTTMHNKAAAELHRLHALNGELLEALKGMFDQLDLDGCIIPAVLKARAAIAKAEGGA